MRLKYLQALSNISDHLDNILNEFTNNSTYGAKLLRHWDIGPDNFDDIKEEKEAIRYLIGCQHGVVHHENTTKPSVEVFKRLFTRELHYLGKVYSCNKYNYRHHNSDLIQKRYLACNHYLQQVSIPEWYAKLPDEILSLDNMYPSR